MTSPLRLIYHLHQKPRHNKPFPNNHPFPLSTLLAQVKFSGQYVFPPGLPLFAELLPTFQTNFRHFSCSLHLTFSECHLCSHFTIYFPH